MNIRKLSKVADDDTSYYKSQLSRIKTDSEYSPKVLFVSGEGSKTNYIDVNPTSAKAIIEWLTANYVNKAV
jgi:hypothetical protein